MFINDVVAASILRQTRETWEDREIDVFEEISERFAHIFNRGDPTFDYKAFYAAAGVFQESSRKIIVAQFPAEEN